MKKYLLPALISLTFLSPLAMAESEHAHEHGTPPPVASMENSMAAATSAPPSMNMSDMSGMTGMAEQPPAAHSREAMMQKRMEKRKEMQALWQKIQEAKTPEERQKLMEEQRKMMQSHHEEMRKEMQQMQQDDMQQDDMMPPPPWGYGPPPGYGRRMGGRPQMDMNDDMDGPPPMMMHPRHRMMMNQGRDEGGCKMMDMMDKMDMDGNEGFQQHRATMEKRMENIEKLLEKIADSLSKQAK
jgi:hypothetical protein